jgi:hypothetical protein
MPPKLLPKDAAARELGGVSPRTVDRLRAAGELATVRVRGRVMVCAASLDAYIERQRGALRTRTTIEEEFPLPALDERRRASRERAAAHAEGRAA